MNKLKSILGKISPKRAIDTVIKRRVAKAIVAAIVAALAYYGYEASSEVQEAGRVIVEAVLAAF